MSAAGPVPTTDTTRDDPPDPSTPHHPPLRPPRSIRTRDTLESRRGGSAAWTHCGATSDALNVGPDQIPESLVRTWQHEVEVGSAFESGSGLRSPTVALRGDPPDRVLTRSRPRAQWPDDGPLRSRRSCSARPWGREITGCNRRRRSNREVQWAATPDVEPAQRLHRSGPKPRSGRRTADELANRPLTCDRPARVIAQPSTSSSLAIR